jgi:probable H4MPT-linked C1 transfer pathway protein
VQSDGAGHLQAALQLPCTLWRGLDHLARAIAEVRQQLAPTQRHGITMTGELADLFLDRTEGVDRLTAAMRAAFPDADLRIYAGEAGFIAPTEAARRVRDVASANWHASARFVAARRSAGLFIDIGSTTTDIIPFAEGRCRAVGFTDDERLISEELVYTGVTRTPVMALAEAVPFAGQRQRLMAEYFATVADVHRLTGALPDDAEQHDTADGRGKSPEDSARRLARMLGRDLESADLAAWRRLARHLSERQLQMIQAAADRVLSRSIIAEDAPVIGAGIGRFLARQLAERLGRPYIDFATLVSGTPEACEWAARCAPAAAVAALAAAG